MPPKRAGQFGRGARPYKQGKFQKPGGSSQTGHDNSEIQQSLEQIKKNVADLKKKQENTEKRVARNEALAREKNLRVYGVRCPIIEGEQDNREKLIDVIMEILRDGVKLSPEVLGEFRIDRIQRAEADGKAIVFSLENYGHIQTILKQKKKLQDYECPWPLPNLPVHQKPRVSIVADLTRENMALRTECLKVLEKMTQDGKSAKIVGFRKISLNNAKPADYRSFKEYRP